MRKFGKQVGQFGQILGFFAACGVVLATFVLVFIAPVFFFAFVASYVYDGWIQPTMGWPLVPFMVWCGIFVVIRMLLPSSTTVRTSK